MGLPLLRLQLWNRYRQCFRFDFKGRKNEFRYYQPRFACIAVYFIDMFDAY